MPQVVVQETLTTYADTGKGPVLLCVHGWMHDGESFSQLTQVLGKKMRVISPDLPNFGNSQVNKDICNINDYTKFLAEFIVKLKIQNYTLVGHSMGGQIAIRGVAGGVLQPKKLVLISSAGIRDNRRVYKLFMKSVSKVLRYITPKRLKNHFYSAIGSDYNADLSDVHKKIINQTLGTDILADAGQVDTPTLLVYGSEDTSTPLWMGEKLAGAIKGSKLKVINGENHWPHQTAAHKTSSLIKEFIGEG